MGMGGGGGGAKPRNAYFLDTLFPLGFMSVRPNIIIYRFMSLLYGLETLTTYYMYLFTAHIKHDHILLKATW